MVEHAMHIDRAEAVARLQLFAREGRAEKAEGERDQWQQRESETQDALQAIGEDFGAYGGEPRTDAMRRLLSEAESRADEARADALREAAALLEPANGEILLAAGEMSASELRTVKSVLGWRRSAILALIDKPKGGDANASGARDASKTIPATSPGITAGASAVEDDLCKRLEGKVVWSADGLDCIPDNTAIEAAARIRSLSSRVERAEQLAYTGAISRASIDEDAPRPETWKERAENRQAVFLLAKRRAEAAESEAAALRERVGLLEKALEPFAEAATKGEIRGYPPNYFVGATEFENARRARTALEGRDNG